MGFCEEKSQEHWSGARWTEEVGAEAEDGERHVRCLSAPHLAHEEGPAPGNEPAPEGRRVSRPGASLFPPPGRPCRGRCPDAGARRPVGTVQRLGAAAEPGP